MVLGMRPGVVTAAVGGRPRRRRDSADAARNLQPDGKSVVHAFEDPVVRAAEHIRGHVSHDHSPRGDLVPVGDEVSKAQVVRDVLVPLVGLGDGQLSVRGLCDRNGLGSVAGVGDDPSRQAEAEDKRRRTASVMSTSNRRERRRIQGTGIPSCRPADGLCRAALQRRAAWCGGRTACQGSGTEDPRSGRRAGERQTRRRPRLDRSRAAHCGGV